MKISLEKAKNYDIKTINNIYNDAKDFMKLCNLNQWSDNYPNYEMVERDIKDENLYILKSNSEILAVVAIFFGEEPTYKCIYDGDWGADEPYATIHRVAVSKTMRGKGVVQDLFTEIKKLVVLNGYSWIRIDTHKDNIPMNKSIKKEGFTKRGIIFVADKTQRIAYDIKCGGY